MLNCRADPLPLSVALLQIIQFPFVRAYHRVEVARACRRAPRGPVIVVSNHTSGADPMFIQAYYPRLIRWMMAAEYFDVPAAGWLFRAVRVIPVQRSGRDLSSTREAMRTLAEGGVIGVFPEGRIEKTRELLPFHSGVAMLAIRSGAAVLPVHIDGSQRNRPMLDSCISPQRVRLSFGDPLHFEGFSTDRTDLDRATERIQSAVKALAG
jgi:1-acyl-sn-glycerol-3-phosphate acyltransferase